MTTTLNPRLSFETCVVGAANRLAVTAGRAVAENPGTVYNPLFVYSGSGLGKTHLLMAIGQSAKKLFPNLNIEYLSLDEYVEAFHAAVAAGQGDAFRRRFQNVDVLLIDDVQFLTNRKEMQTELLRLIEALQSGGHQIVLTSDRPPAEIADLDERLISRFSGGLVVDMGVPDYETRVAILRRKAEERATSFQSGVLETVALYAVLRSKMVVDAVVSGTAEASRRCVETRDRIQRYPLHAAMKRILARRGVPIGGAVRRPLRSLSADESRQVDALADELVGTLPAAAGPR